MTPEGWRKASVSSLGEVVAGKAKNTLGDGELRPYLRVANVFDGRIDLTDVLEMPFSVEEFARYKLEPGDVLLNEGQSLELVGRCAMYRGEFWRACGIQNALIRFRSGPDIIADFAEQLFRWCQRSGVFAEIATQTTSIAHLGVRRFAELELAIPPLHEQRKIAAILSSVDAAIESTQAVIDQLGVVKKAMMAELLTRGIPGRHTRFKMTEIGEVPEEWAVTTVGDLGSFAGGNGFRPPDWSTSGLPIIRIQNLNGSQDFNYYAGTPDPAWIVAPGELLFAWAGSKGASFGPCLWPGPTGVLNQHIHRIQPSARVLKTFLFYLLKLMTVEVEKRAHGFKDTLVHLKKGELTGWPVCLPGLPEQDEIISCLDGIEARLVAESDERAALELAKATLMSVLLTGEVRVKPDDEAMHAG